MSSNPVARGGECAPIQAAVSRMPSRFRLQPFDRAQFTPGGAMSGFSRSRHLSCHGDDAGARNAQLIFFVAVIEAFGEDAASRRAWCPGRLETDAAWQV